MDGDNTCAVCTHENHAMQCEVDGCECGAPAATLEAGAAGESA
jgi:hypothetical protein